jgi:class 3 adenylate cyclase
MTEAARIDGGPAAYRGFLFSDLRGFTAFAEKFGNAAAAAKVNAFLEIARRAISRHDGAEVMTEGDAIHAVFPSASSAVLCGLEIVDATAELNEEEPHRAIGLGVGVHAGEAVETAEGYIGRAVNIAARLCAAAKPGEVLVSSTVKGITQASIPVGFIPRGRRKLKGISDPIVVYAVTRDMTARPPREVPRVALVGVAGVVVVAAIAVAMLAGSQLLPKQAASAGPSASAAPLEQPVAIGPLAIGAYASRELQPPVTFDIVDQGWTANRDQAGMLGLIREVPPRGSIYFLRVDEVIANPCIAGGEGTETGPTAPDVLATLEALDHLELTTPVPVEVGGHPGQQVDVTVSDGVLAACGGLVGSEAAIFRVGKDVWSAASGERFRVVSVDVGDQAVTIVLSSDWTQIRSVQEQEDLLKLGQRVLDSVGF